MLIQHNPNEGLKLRHKNASILRQNGAHSAQPERGIETTLQGAGGAWSGVLIQHNPNEGLKLVLPVVARKKTTRAHSAQPERGIETLGRCWKPQTLKTCSFSTTRTRD